MELEWKTSEEWSKLCKHVVLDPDGWDRKNFRFSWHEEKITKEEFEKRFCQSTCQFSGPIYDKDRKVFLTIWKEEVS